MDIIASCFWRVELYGSAAITGPRYLAKVELDPRSRKDKKKDRGSSDIPRAGK
jgi:hypothetical protein